MTVPGLMSHFTATSEGIVEAMDGALGSGVKCAKRSSYSGWPRKSTEVSPVDTRKQAADDKKSASPIDPKGLIDAPKQYDTNRAKLAEAVFDCIYVSNKTGGRDAGERCYWASVLFTKFTTTAISLLKLLPKRHEEPGRTSGSFRSALDNNWDFTAVAALSRTLYENSLNLFNLCFEPIEEDEWLSRLNLMQLHDWTTRQKTFHRNQPESQNYTSVLEDLHRKLNSRGYFKSLAPKKRTEYLRGTKVHFQSHEEILTRMGKTGVEGYVTFWHWWSSYAHSFPMSYYRMSEQSRGHGIQNDQDIMYIAASLELLLQFMTDSLGGMRKLFPDIETPEVYLKNALAQRARAAEAHSGDPPDRSTGSR